MMTFFKFKKGGYIRSWGSSYSRFKVRLTVVVLCLALGNSWTLPFGASIHLEDNEWFHLMLLCKDFGVGGWKHIVM